MREQAPRRRDPARPEDVPATCATFRRALRSAERTPPRSAPASAPDGVPALEAVRAHVAHCAPCQVRFGARLHALEAIADLRVRDVPDGVLDDLYEAVRERLPYAPAGGGMSLSFLDAPRALRRWRAAALAASLLLAVGAGWTLSGGFGSAGVPQAGGAPFDPREQLLQALDARSAPSTSTYAEVLPAGAFPVSADRLRGQPRFFVVSPVPDADTQPAEHERLWK